MKQEYPKCIYRDDNSFTVVVDVETHDKLKPYFNCENPDHSKPFVEISLKVALDMFKDSEHESLEVEEAIRREDTLRASRDQVQLNKVLNGNNNRRSR
jgi:hypothetical protein